MRKPKLHLRLGSTGTAPACGHGAPAIGSLVTADAARVTCRRCLTSDAYARATRTEA